MTGEDGRRSGRGSEEERRIAMVREQEREGGRGREGEEGERGEEEKLTLWMSSYSVADILARASLTNKIVTKHGPEMGKKGARSRSRAGQTGQMQIHVAG